MKLNSATAFFAATGIGYGLMSLWMLATGRLVMALLCLFLVVLCVMIIKVGSVDDEHHR